MQSRLYDSITVLSHFIAMILIIVIFLITNSIYLILFTALLPLYLILLNLDNVDKYFRYLKNYVFIILLIFLLIVLITRHITFMLVFKYIIIVLIVNNFISRLTFKKTNTLLCRLLFLLPGRDIISYKLTLKLYYINSIFMSKDEIAKFQEERNNRRSGLRYGLLSRIEYAEYKRDKLDSNLKTSFYKVERENPTLLSVLNVLLFIIILIVLIIRK